jgi:hypothetical protein
MNPVIPIADPLPLPAPPLLSWALLQFTFLLHLLAMNVVWGGSLLALHWRLSGREEDASHRASLLAFFAKALPVAIAAAVTLGVAPLLFVQVLYGRLFFASAILMAAFWLSVVPLVIVAYYGAYLIAFRGEALGARARWAAGLIALLFTAVAFLYTANFTQLLRPDTFLAAHRAESRGLVLGLADPTFWPRLLHTLFGAVAVAGLGVALHGVWRRGDARDPAFPAWAIRRGTTAFGIATAANIVVGLVYLMTLPRPVLLGLVGGDAHGTGLLVLGIVLAVGIAGHGLFALGARDPAKATRALAGAALFTVVVMVLLRDRVRTLSLHAAGFEQPAAVAAQWGPFLVFLACLLVAVGTIAWMARALARGAKMA